MLTVPIQNGHTKIVRIGYQKLKHAPSEILISTNISANIFPVPIVIITLIIQKKAPESTPGAFF
jgi:hypothetical protein